MINLNQKERENLDNELKKYPAYMVPVVEHLLKNYSLDKETLHVQKDSLGAKEMAHVRNFETIET